MTPIDFEGIKVIRFFFSLVLLNIVLYVIGSGVLGFKPSDMTLGTESKAPTEFRPQDIQLIKK